MPKDARRYPKQPIVGVGALIFRRGRILLVERGREPMRGYWSLPGGALEAGERLVDGVRREVLEETGLIVEPVALATVFERIVIDAAGRAEYHYVLIDYICRVCGGQAAPASDVSAIAWVAEHELARYRLTEGTLPVIRQAFRKRRARARKHS